MIRAIRRRLSVVVDRQTSERGLSLAELLVSMTVFGFLLAMTGGFLVNASRANITNRAIDATNRTAANSMDEVTRVLRGASTNVVAGQSLPDPAFVQATDNAITVYSYVNLASSSVAPIRVQFFVDATTKNLVERTWTASLSNGFYTFPSVLTCTTSCTSRILGTPVVLPAAGGPKIFTYLDSTGAAIPTVVGAVAIPQVSNVAAVTVSLQFGASSSANQSTLLTNTVGLPNLNVARTN
ncbi:hypothetical protein VH571_13820 [Frondihabitans sp. 4ASC-45]|uniref:prepilin-type N-terminal cleavage/methylation domain-containing protein n=1 Tax=Frondihabitans sp. 4ASC-45 TaxID=3111636 RepID=UPI003C208F07